MSRMPRKESELGVVEAAASGDRLSLLTALRTRLAVTIEDGCSPRDLVGLSRRLIDVQLDIDALTASDDTGPRLRVVDEVFDPSSI